MVVKEKAWKHIFNTNGEFSQNCTEKQVMLFKATVNCLFDDIWCYLIIDCFDWKITAFWEAVVRGLLYPQIKNILKNDSIMNICKKLQ